MKKENLRKVLYSLEGESSINPLEIPNNGQRAELIEMKKERQGLFHGYANRVFVENGHSYPETYAMVEDVETGSIKDVVPKRIKFVN